MQPRSSLRWSLAGALLASAMACGASCNSNGKPSSTLSDVKPQPTAPPNEGLTEGEATKLLPGVDTGMLTPKQRQDLVELSRDTFCPCSAETVAACVRKSPMTCRPALREVELAKKLLLAGAPEAKALMLIEAYYSSFDESHRIALPEDGPTKGPAKAPIVVQEFSDFQCPVCKAANPVLAEIVKKYPEDVKLIFRNFPLPMHEHAMKAALCAAYTYDKGGSAAFWKMVDHFYSHQELLGDDEYKAAAAAAGVNGADMLATVEKSPRYDAQIEADKAAGTAAKIGGTPSIFINGRQYVLPVSVDLLSWALDDEKEWMANGKKWATK
jgi:protein-disulfide isomerase